MGVDLEKKRKLLLYPIEYQRGCPCEWVLEFARAAETAGRLRDAAPVGQGCLCGSGMGARRSRPGRRSEPLGPKCVFCQHNRQRSNYKD